MNWIPLNEAQIQADFPTDLLPLYTQWVADNPAKAGRLAAIIERTAQEFRDSILSNPSNSVDPDPAAIPTSCLRHAETIVFYNLMMEMGIAIKDEAQESNTRADMFLRQITYKHFKATAEDSEASPHYEVPENATLRTLPALLITFHFLLLTSALAGWVDSTQPSGPLYSLQEIDPVWATGKTSYLKVDSFMSLCAATNQGMVWHPSPRIPTVDNVYSPTLLFHFLPQTYYSVTGFYLYDPGDYVVPDPAVKVTLRQWVDMDPVEPTIPVAAHYGFDCNGAHIRNATFFGDGGNLSNLPPCQQSLALTGGTMSGSIDLSDGDLFNVAAISSTVPERKERALYFDDGTIEGQWSFEIAPYGLTNCLAISGGTLCGPVTNHAGFHGDGRGLTNLDFTGLATGTPLYAESDPVWTLEKSAYATGTPVYAETDPVWTAASGAFAATISARLASNVWGAADSTTNYFPKTGGTMNGPLTVQSNLAVTGNIGINTLSPTRKLTVVGDSAPLIHLKSSDNNSSDLLFGLDPAYVYFQSTASGSGTIRPLSFWVGSVERFRVATNGNLGIGTPTPESKLHVVGGLRANDITLGRADDNTEGRIYFWDTEAEDWSPRIHMFGARLCQDERGYAYDDEKVSREGDTMTGGLNVLGSISSTHFMGNGKGLTNVPAAIEIVYTNTLSIANTNTFRCDIGPVSSEAAGGYGAYLLLWNGRSNNRCINVCSLVTISKLYGGVFAVAKRDLGDATQGAVQTNSSTTLTYEVTINSGGQIPQWTSHVTVYRVLQGSQGLNTRWGLTNRPYLSQISFEHNGHLNMLGNSLSNAVYSGDGAGLTNLAQSITVVTNIALLRAGPDTNYISGITLQYGTAMKFR